MRIGAVGGIIAALFAVLCAAAAVPGKAGLRADQAAQEGTAQGSVLLPFVGKDARVHPEAPEIEIAPPSGDLYAGRTYTVTVRVSDPNNDLSHVTAEQQPGMGDRYTGTEYVTAQQLPHLVLDGEDLVVKADYPGNYRVWVRATDSMGLRSQESVDLPVYWAPGENPFAYRGFSDGSFIPFFMSDVTTVLQRTVNDGANYVELSPALHMESMDSTEIAFCPAVWYEGAPCHNYSDELLIDTIDAAHVLGLGVLIKPMIAIGDNWGGHPPTMHPTDWDVWFGSYTARIVHYAEIAQRMGVEMFCVGNELVSSHHQASNWQALVDAVRDVYPDGELTYSDNWVVLRWLGEYENDPFPVWRTLDKYGVAFYFSGSGGDWYPDAGSTSPSVEQMVDHMMLQMNKKLIPAVEELGMDVLATEMGISNWDGTNIIPWDLYQFSGDVDNQEQVDWLEAAFRVMAGLPYFRGFYFFRMQLRLDRWTYNPDGAITAPDIKGQPAERAILHWSK